MKAILGVDEARTYLPVLNLLSRLRLADLDLELVHVDHSGIVGTKKDFGFAGGAELAQLDVDDSVIGDAVQTSDHLGLGSSHRIVYGSPAEELVACAEETKALLICIGSKRRSKFNSSLFGSIGKSLTLSSRQSILIAKGEIEETHALTVVATTDFSNYSDRALKEFIRMAPKGVRRVILLTAIDRQLVANVSREQIHLFRAFLNDRADKLVAEFVAAGFHCDHKLLDGDLGEVVESLMAETKADLLVMGAQGEGYQPRVSIGSSALKQVVSSRHSILVLRP